MEFKVKVDWKAAIIAAIMLALLLAIFMGEQANLPHLE